MVKLTDSNNNPIQNKTINFQVIQGVGTVSSPTTITTYDGEAKVNLTCPNLASTVTQVQASSNTNPLLTAIFNIITSRQTTLTFNDIMAGIKNNEDKILDLTADVVTTSNDPYSCPEEQSKIWVKEDKAKLQILSPVQETSVITETQDKIYLDGQEFLDKLIGTPQAGETITNIIESYSAQIYVLRTTVKSANYEENKRLWVDYSKGTVIKSETTYEDEYLKYSSIVDYTYVLINDDVWVPQKTVITYNNLVSGEIYTTTETKSNIIINSGIPDSVFQ